MVGMARWSFLLGRETAYFQGRLLLVSGSVPFPTSVGKSSTGKSQQLGTLLVRCPTTDGITLVKDFPVPLWWFCAYNWYRYCAFWWFSVAQKGRSTHFSPPKFFHQKKYQCIGTPRPSRLCCAARPDVRVAGRRTARLAYPKRFGCVQPRHQKQCSSARPGWNHG